ncbi:hypothetical protein K9K77_01760 [Candidatus Babeliales bacterium]|nr:hypothetical protein [Candidatus Babeliales bacterium]
MRKWVILFSFFIMGNFINLGAQDTLFGYKTINLQVQEESIKKCIRNHYLKKAAFYGSSALLIGLVWSNHLKGLLDSSHRIISAQEYHKIVEDKSWSQWFMTGGKWIGAKALESSAISIISNKFLNIMSKCQASVSLEWYLNSQADTIAFLKDLEADADVLPLEEDSAERCYKAIILEEKLKVIIPSLMNIIAYMNYRSKMVEKDSLLEATRMKCVSNHVKNSLENLCITLESLLYNYKNGTNNQEVMEQSVAIPTALSVFTEHFYSDLKTFELYEQQS